MYTKESIITMAQDRIMDELKNHVPVSFMSISGDAYCQGVMLTEDENEAYDILCQVGFLDILKIVMERDKEQDLDTRIWSSNYAKATDILCRYFGLIVNDQVNELYNAMAENDIDCIDWFEEMTDEEADRIYNFAVNLWK